MTWEEAKELTAQNCGYKFWYELESWSDRGGIELDDAYKLVSGLMVLAAEQKIYQHYNITP